MRRKHFLASCDLSRATPRLWQRQDTGLFGPTLLSPILVSPRPRVRRAQPSLASIAWLARPERL